MRVLQFWLLTFMLFVVFSCVEEIPPSEPREDGAVMLNIPLSGSLQNGAFSPDGQSIVFTRFEKGYNLEPAEIYRFHVETEKLTLLVSDGSGNINLPGSSWNDGLIVFASTRDPHDEIYVISADGEPGDEYAITVRSDSVAYEPSFSPDGEWTVFESHLLDEEGNGIIMKYKLDGSSSYINLTEKGYDCRQPNWSPGNNKILYQRLKTDEWSIWTMNIDGTDKMRVTNGIGNCTDASFSGDGEHVVFSSDFNVSIANIYSVSVDGSSPKRLTEFDGYDGAPSISYDGTQIVFESIDGEPNESNGTKLMLKKL